MDPEDRGIHQVCAGHRIVEAVQRHAGHWGRELLDTDARSIVGNIGESDVGRGAVAAQGLDQDAPRQGMCRPVGDAVGGIRQLDSGGTEGNQG